MSQRQLVNGPKEVRIRWRGNTKSRAVSRTAQVNQPEKACSEKVIFELGFNGQVATFQMERDKTF